MVSASPRIGRTDFQAVVRTGRRAERGPMRIHWRMRPGAQNRLGVAIKSHTLRRAVDRNRWKRIVREIARRGGFYRASGCDAVIVLVRGPHEELTLGAWRDAVLALLHATGAC